MAKNTIRETKFRTASRSFFCSNAVAKVYSFLCQTLVLFASLGNEKGGFGIADQRSRKTFAKFPIFMSCL